MVGLLENPTPWSTTSPATLTTRSSPSPGTTWRVMPYYVGDKRLITLMMKMDADVVVMTLDDLDNSTSSAPT